MHQINKLFGEKLHMVNIGVETFYQDRTHCAASADG